MLPVDFLKRKEPVLMGIVNLTPDSFSDGIPGGAVDDFLTRAKMLIRDGAHVLDIGAESTRPGAELISCDEELSRLVPFLKSFRGEFPDFPLSLDTRKTKVAVAVRDFGIHIINDTSCLADTTLAESARDMGAFYVLMHGRGTPSTMMGLTDYAGGLVTTVFAELRAKIAVLKKNMFPMDRLILDPGIGFAKTPEQSRELVETMGAWPNFSAVASGDENVLPLLLGISRKRFLELYVGQTAPHERDEISAQLAKRAVTTGFRIIRTHNVALTKRVLCG